jgi:20S proteasome subunit beta 2
MASLVILAVSVLGRASDRPFCSEALSGRSLPPALWSGDDDESSTMGFTRKVSRARIETPLTEEDIFSRGVFDQKETAGWTQRELDLRSTDYATTTMRHPTGDSSTRASHNHPRANELRLHLLQNVQNDDSMRQSSPPPLYKSNHLKTGTTICGCVCRGHVILAADTRATQNTLVADKVAQKLHPLANNAWCAGAGTSADLEMLTRLCLYSLALDRLQSTTIGNGATATSSTEVAPMYTTPDKEEEDNALLVGNVSLEQVCSFLQDRLLKAQGQLGVNLILGCVDGKRAHLRAFHEHGSMDVDLPFAALGSGGLAAMSIMERDYQANLTVPEAIELVQSAIVAGIQNDLGSGSQVDLCVIAPDGSSRMQRCVVPPQILQDLLEDQDLDVDFVSSPNPNTIGTNGFGNTPFGINSKRVIVTGKGEERLDQWSSLLGMT